MSRADLLRQLERLEAYALDDDEDRRLAALSDAELEAEVLAGRPDWAEAFRERGDPRTWPERATLDGELHDVYAETYDHWRRSPETFLTELDAPRGAR